MARKRDDSDLREKVAALQAEVERLRAIVDEMRQYVRMPRAG